jgi:hypothetical protein
LVDEADYQESERKRGGRLTAELPREDVYAAAVRDLEEKHAVLAQENAVLRKQERKQARVLN